MFQPGEFTNTELFYSFIISILFAFIASYYAEKKGRSNLGWFILGFMFTIFALVALYFLSSLKSDDQKPASTTPSVLSPDILLQSQVDPLLPLPFELNKVDNKLWYYLDQEHRQMGPVSLIALREEWKRGLLELNSYVWAEGMEKWEKVDMIPDLKDALNKE